MCYTMVNWYGMWCQKMTDLDDDRPPSPTTTSTSGNLSAEAPPLTLTAREFELALNKEANEDELVNAIKTCKHLVLESDQLSVERKWLVRYLIELRFRLQEYREAMIDPQHPKNKSIGASKRTIQGHHFNLQPLLSNTTYRYCDHCTGKIWSVIQAWYECEDCGYACHYKCLAFVLRQCAHVVATERGTYEFEICPEIGLSQQKYQCFECKTHLPINKDWSDARRCDYTGLYYCSACHWGSSAIIPARVIHNWDFTAQQVSQASLQQLRITAKRPLIKLDQLNPKLFTFVHELNLVRRLRKELYGMKKYLVLCRIANENHLLRSTVQVPYWVDTPDVYSLQDLVETNSGELPSKLHDIVEIFVNHIKQTCEICQGRGHICEICSNDKVIFPFEDTSFVCNKCGCVLHSCCYERKNACPKCIRLKNRIQEEKNNNDTNDAQV